MEDMPKGARWRVPILGDRWPGLRTGARRRGGEVAVPRRPSRGRTNSPTGAGPGAARRRSWSQLADSCSAGWFRESPLHCSDSEVFSRKAWRCRPVSRAWCLRCGCSSVRTHRPWAGVESRRATIIYPAIGGRAALGVSYWVNGWLVAMLGLCAIRLLAQGTSGLESRSLPLLSLLAAWVSSASEARGTRWARGVLRRPTAGGRMSSWSGAAKAGVVIGAIVLVAVFTARGLPAMRAALESRPIR